MATQKDIAIKQILTDFEAFSNLTLQQLDLLEKHINSDETEISENQLKKFKKNEKLFDQFEVNISERIINSIVLYNPMASDIRILMACYRMSLNMERIGDLIMNIVQFISKIKDPEIYKKSIDLIDKMLAISRKMVTRALVSFINKDTTLAIWTIKNDEVVDEYHHKLLKKSIMGSDVSKEVRNLLLSYMDLKSIISNIERIADHATNIAEASIYAHEGTDIRHKGSL